MYLAAVCSLAASCQNRSPHPGGLQEFLDILKMLLCKHFRWRHDTCLITVSDCNQSCQYRNHCFAATHISLQQTVHLVTAFHVVADLSNHTFLSSGQREGERVIAFVESLSDTRHEYALLCTAPYVFLLQK